MLKQIQAKILLNKFVIHVYINHTPVASTSSPAHAQIQAEVW